MTINELKVQVYVRQKELIYALQRGKKEFDKKSMFKTSMSQYIVHLLAKQLLVEEE